MKNPLLSSLYDPPPITDGAGYPTHRNSLYPERLHPPPYPGSSVIPIFPSLSKNHNNYASMMIEASGGPPPLEYDPDAIPSPAYPSVNDSEMTTPSGLNVRAEEIGLVLLVLLLWVGAVALFFNRWGKIRMLEPYQPKFIDAPRGSLAPIAAAGTGAPSGMSTAPHRLSYPLIELAHTSRLHHHSRMNISASACCGDHPTADHQQSALSSGRRRPSASPSGIFVHHYPTHPARHHHGSSSSCLSPGLPFYGDGIGSVGDPYYHQHQQRPRQNSVVVFATAHFMTAARRVKSAMDLQTLVLREETEESVHALSCTAGGEASGLMGSSTADNHLAVGTITCV
ncbi:uncharacterized protein LOC116916310 [Daphnia magna]|uniref:Fibronectin type III domain-containing protein n=2 Tax=Daphnia magna TaxID=35525 RepID=A0A0P6F8I7_9CRUS|nr:uncharacterized protein LOC116916310 [Daphnia magna]KAK4020582.1 hypothetical protein OUZ56_002547 [Daphnia magna]KZS15627.1 Uncharacterized protein APZ42_018813 [Daphnia magna]